MRGKPPLLALVALASVLASSGCGSGYQYIKNDNLGVYARLPDGWAVYDETDLHPDASERDLERMGQVQWVRTFHGGNGDHAVELSNTTGNPVPSGVVLIQVIPPRTREVLDLRTMRGLGDDSMDPLTLEQNPPPTGQTFNVIQDEPVTMDGGYSGLHTVYAVTNPGQGPYVVDQTVLRNSASTAMVEFIVSCTEECYFETYKDEIADLVDSWTIQEVRS